MWNVALMLCLLSARLSCSLTPWMSGRLVLLVCLGSSSGHSLGCSFLMLCFLTILWINPWKAVLL